MNKKIWNLNEFIIGYWEPHTACIDWCEINYIYTIYIAELWNVISLTPMMFECIIGNIVIS